MNFFYNSRVFGIPLASLVATTTLIVNQNLVIAQESPVIQTIDFTENILSIEFSAPVNEDLDVSRSSDNQFRLIFSPNIQCQKCSEIELSKPAEVSYIKIDQTPDPNGSRSWGIEIASEEGYRISHELIPDKGEENLKKFKLTFTANEISPSISQSPASPEQSPTPPEQSPTPPEQSPTPPEQSPTPPEQSPTPLSPNILGVWDVAESSNVSLKSIRFRRDSTIELNYGDYNLLGEYLLDNKKSPTQITITIDGSSLTTIYEISGETLKLGSNKLDDPIPSDFTNAIVFQRSE